MEWNKEIDIYCNSCKYAFENNACCCEKYAIKEPSILDGGLCVEYIRHKDKELSKELAEKLDLAILYSTDISMEHAIDMGKSLIHSQCADCEYKIGFDECSLFGKRPYQYASPLHKTPCPRRKITLESRIKGALYGFAVGDAMGATTEFMTHEEIKNKYGIIKDILGGGWLNLQLGEVTDDTQMTLCVCKALEDTLDRNNPTRQNVNFFEKCCEYFVEWFDSKPADIGNCCRNVISHCRKYDFKEWVHFAYNPNSLGNGSLMRSMPPILAKQSLDTTLIQGRLTHNNTVCDDCIEEYYLMLNQCLNGELDKIPLGYKLKNPTGHVKNTLNNALFWFFETETAEEAIMGAVNHGGDSDTIAAITGSLAGAYYGVNGIPTRWKYDLKPEITEMLDHYAQFFLQIWENTKER